jgi:hypothetical protein
MYTEEVVEHACSIAEVECGRGSYLLFHRIVHPSPPCSAQQDMYLCMFRMGEGLPSLHDDVQLNL